LKQPQSDAHFLGCKKETPDASKAPARALSLSHRHSAAVAQHSAWPEIKEQKRIAAFILNFISARI